MIGLWGPARAQARSRTSRSGTAKTIESAARGARSADHVRRRVRLRAVRRPRDARASGTSSGALRPEPVGYQALDSLRIEKGYRYFGTDLTASDTPFDSGRWLRRCEGQVPNSTASRRRGSHAARRRRGIRDGLRRRGRARATARLISRVERRLRLHGPAERRAREAAGGARPREPRSRSTSSASSCPPPSPPTCYTTRATSASAPSVTKP